MKNLRPFQIFILAIFGFMALLSIVLLSNFSPKASQEEFAYGNQVIIWGTLDSSTFQKVFSDIERTDKAFNKVSYSQIDANNFDEILVSAIAESRGPDLVLLPSSEFVHQRNRLLAITYDTLPERQFRDTYIDGAEIFAQADGIYAIPLFVDPMVMYWNRDLLSSAGLAQAPTTWEYVVNTMVPLLTRRDTNRNIIQSALAFGEFQNVQNAKEIILTLLLQSGSKMVYEDREQYQVDLNRSYNDGGLPPLEATAQFFLNFSNPNSQLYSWNRAQPLDKNAFVSGDLALYMGYGSELGRLTQQNPNLNFDVAEMPQGATASIRRTYGEFYGLAIPKASVNPGGAYAVANVLASPAVSTALGEPLGLVPASRSALAVGSDNPFRQVILRSGLVARAWLDPDAEATDGIFKAMVEDISSGRSSVGMSIQDAQQKIKLAF